VLVVGAGQSGQEIARLLAYNSEKRSPYCNSGYQMLGFVDDDARPGTMVAGMPVLGQCQDLRALVTQKAIDLIVIATHCQLQPELLQSLLDCREQNVCLEPMTSLYERLTGRVPVEYAGNELHVVLPVPDSATTRLGIAGKRLLDLGAGCAGLLALLLVAPWVAVANLFSSPGPLFYRQKRVGKGGIPFSVYKFRSMIPQAEKGTGAVWAAEDDNRITPVGRWLRKTRLDELPQVINILKGEMSLVGPRPERPEFVSELIKQVPFYQARHAVRPGLTGWAQVRYRYGSSVDDSLVKLQYDLYYIKHLGISLEAAILVKTAAVMLGLQGR
jgi:exopolysaccharide biosynthesis polyprenyl glycosylphosphotransferase